MDRLGTRFGRWLWRHGVGQFWRFLGRLGLALRALGSRLLWQPMWWLTRPFRYFGHGLWRLWGRMGMALRFLLTYGVWWPLLLLLYPVTLAYERVLLPGLNWLGVGGFRLVFGLTRWVIRGVVRLVRQQWRATALPRALWRRRRRSQWLIFRARVGILFRRPRPPQTAVSLPHLPLPPNVRRWRVATSLVTAVAILLVGFFAFQERPPDRVIAENFLPRIIVATPTPLPQETAVPITPTSSPTPIPTPWPTPDPLNEGGSLAFTQRQGGNNDIYILPVGQAEPLRLTSHPAEDRDPAWSPNGRDIAFTSHRDGDWEIYVYNLPDSRLLRVTDRPGLDAHPQWSPDGQWLVYESYRHENLDIYIVRADGREGPYRLTENPTLDYAPVWSPGGRHVAFVSWRGGNPDIFLLSLDQVSDATAVNLTGSPAAQEDAPAFSPDGRFLAFTDASDGFPFMYALPLDETYAVIGPVTSLGQQGTQPAWSPDSQSLVYVVEKGERTFLLAGSPNAWGVAPQAFASNGRLSSPSWSAVTLPLELIDDWSGADVAGNETPLFVEALAPLPTPETAVSALTPTPIPVPAVQLFQVPVNAPSPYLSDRVDQSFLALRQRVLTTAGWDALGQLDNMFAALDSQPLPGQPVQSWNKAGRAFDLPYREALAFDPRLEVVREDIGTETYWRIYLRATAQDGSQGEPLRQVPWDFRARYGDEPTYYDAGGKLKEAIPAGYYIDFTALAADYGWIRVPASGNWRTFFPGIRFWHFENQGGLTWEEAMAEIYTPQQWEGEGIK